MKITPNFPYQQTFQGFDARKLKAVAMTTNQSGIAQEMKNICNKYNVDVWLASPDSLVSDNFGNVVETCPYTLPWAQDILSMISGEKMLYSWADDGLGWLLEVFKGFKGHSVYDHTKGGNFFIVKNGSADDIFVGSNEIKKYRKDKGYFSDIYGIKNVHILSQPDYHLDLGIRPLNDKNVLVCDDNLMVNKIKEGIDLITKTIQNNPLNSKRLKEIQYNLKFLLNNFLISIKENPYASSNITFNQILDAGFNPIRVPARFYTTVQHGDLQKSLKYDLNFANAVVFEKHNNELVYITNKSQMDKAIGITPEIENQTGFSFEKIFKDALKSYVKEEDTYFVSEKNAVMSEFLLKKDCGIHCLCAEIPI